MTRHVAFLRAINVGNRRVRGQRLVEVFEGLGHGTVDTFLASGNVVFDAEADDPRALERPAEEALEEALGWDVPTFVRTLGHLSSLAARGPFARERSGDPEAAVHVLFLREPPDDGAVRTLDGLELADDLLRLEGAELLWLRRGKLRDAPVSFADLERAVGGVPSTARRLDTVGRIVEKFRVRET